MFLWCADRKPIGDGMEPILEKAVELGNAFIEEQEKIAAQEVHKYIQKRVDFFTWDAATMKQLKRCIQEEVGPVISYFCLLWREI